MSNTDIFAERASRQLEFGESQERQESLRQDFVQRAAEARQSAALAERISTDGRIISTTLGIDSVYLGGLVTPAGQAAFVVASIFGIAAEFEKKYSEQKTREADRYEELARTLSTNAQENALAQLMKEARERAIAREIERGGESWDRAHTEHAMDKARDMDRAERMSRTC